MHACAQSLHTEEDIIGIKTVTPAEQKLGIHYKVRTACMLPSYRLKVTAGHTPHIYTYLFRWFGMRTSC